MLEQAARALIFIFKDFVEVLWEYFLPYYLGFLGCLLLSFLNYWVIKKKIIYFLYFLSLNQNTITMWVYMWFAQRFKLLSLMQLVLDDFNKYNFILAHNRSQLFADDDDLYEYNARTFAEFDDIGATLDDLEDEDKTITIAQETLAQLREDTRYEYINRLPHEKLEDQEFWRCHSRWAEPFWISYKYQTPFGLDRDSERGIDLLFLGTQELRFYLLNSNQEEGSPSNLFDNLFRGNTNAFTNKWSESPLAEISDLTLHAGPNTFYSNWQTFSAQYHPRQVTPLLDTFSDESFAPDTSKMCRKYWKKLYRQGLEVGEPLESLVPQSDRLAFSSDFNRYNEVSYEEYGDSEGYDYEDLEDEINEFYKTMSPEDTVVDPNTFVKSTELVVAGDSVDSLQEYAAAESKGVDSTEDWEEDWLDWTDWVDDGSSLDGSLRLEDLEKLEPETDYNLTLESQDPTDNRELPALYSYYDFKDVTYEFDGEENAKEFVNLKLKESAYDYTSLFSTYNNHCVEEMLYYNDNELDMEDQVSWIESESFTSRRGAVGLIIGYASEYDFAESFRGLYGTIRRYAFKWFWEPNLYRVEGDDEEEWWWGYLKRIKDNPYSFFNYLGEPGFIDYDWIQRICRILLISRWLYLLRPVREHLCNDVVIEEPAQLQSYTPSIPSSVNVVTTHLANTLDSRLLKNDIKTKEWYNETEAMLEVEEREAMLVEERNREAELIRLKEEEEKLRILLEKIWLE